MTAKIPDTDWVYDLETYHDLFSAGFVHVKTGTRFIFEVSARVNQSREFIEFLNWLKDMGHRIFGYNNGAIDQHTYNQNKTEQDDDIKGKAH